MSVLRYLKNQKGVSFAELMLSIAIFLLLIGFVSINLAKSTKHATLGSSVDILVSDIKSQQIKAISGATDGQAAAASYGIFIQANKYTLFRGNSYVSGDPGNFSITLDSRFQLTTTFAGGTLIFSQRSGEIAGLQGQNTITLKTTDGLEQKTITLNKYGVITSVQ